MSEETKIDSSEESSHPFFAWKPLASIDSSFPNIRSNTVSFFYKDTLWMIAGKGAGFLNETWTFSIKPKVTFYPPYNFNYV